MLIYKIFHAAEWEALQAEGETLGAPIDLDDGFIHFSTGAQVERTAELYFAGQERLVLVAVDDAGLGDDLKWEPSRDGALFPHLFRKLTLADVVWDKPLPWMAGAHVFPPGVL